MTLAFRPRKHVGFSPGDPRIAHVESSDHYGNGRRGVYRPDYPDRLIEKWKKQGWRNNRKAGGLFYPSPNSYYDPLSIALVTDLLLRIEPGNFISAAQLVGMLQAQFPHVLWDAVTIGRLMNQLVQEAERVEPPNGGPHPIESIRLTDGRKYLLHLDNAGAHAWLASLREYFGNEAEKKIQVLLEGGEYPSNETVWSSAPDFAWGQKPG